MTYTDNLDQEGIESQYLLVVAPRRAVSTWTLVSGTTYSKAFDYGHAIGVTKDDTDLTEATSVAGTTSGKFYFDYENGILYVNVGADPAGFYMVVTYELYFGTFDAHWYRAPLDDTSRQVYYEPLIMKSPLISASVSDSLFGFLPSNSTTIVVSNLTEFFNRHVYDSSFNDADLRLYHQLGSLSTVNLKLVYEGLVNHVSFSDQDVAFKILDRTNIFKNEYRNPDTLNNFFDPSTFTLIDPNFKNRPIRTVYGAVDGVVGINYDYSAVSGTGTNRYWFLQNGTTSLGSITGTTPSGPACTTTRTYYSGASGYQIGDDVYIDNAVGASGDARVVITALGTASGTSYFEHAAIAVAAASGSTARRGWIGNCYAVKDGVTTRLTLDTHYTELLDSTPGVASVSINQTNVASLLGSTLQAVDSVFCRVYGKKNSITLSATPVGSNSTTTGNLTDIIAILSDILKGAVGLSESNLDVATLQALDATVNDQISFCLPQITGDDFPVIRDFLSKILQTALLRIFINDDGVWSVTQVGPAGSYSKMIQDDEILIPKFDYDFDYQDVVSDVFINYGRSEVNSRLEISTDGSFKTVRGTSNIAKRLHGITRQKTYESLHIVDSEAQTLADRLSYYFGDRRGILKIATKNRFFDTQISDVIRVSRTRLPGYDYDEDAEQTRDLITQSTAKSLTEIEIELDDQKGIEDNSGSW